MDYFLTILPGTSLFAAMMTGILMARRTSRRSLVICSILLVVASLSAGIIYAHTLFGWAYGERAILHDGVFRFWAFAQGLRYPGAVIFTSFVWFAQTCVVALGIRWSIRRLLVRSGVLTR